MIETNLPQDEADALIAIEKHRIDDQPWNYPDPGVSVHIPLISVNGRENFHLDISRSGINLLKGTYQNRTRQIVVLLRLDFGGQPHRNPDGEEIASPHLHIYREGFSDKWAFPVPTDRFSDLNDRWQTLLDFMRYCNVTSQPRIIRGLFS